MKILKLRFANLNSLAGEWAIDFTDPAYETGGLFAITGPTGAGKTTILDAVCLALYGHTPRLGRITQGTNEIMSRSSGECFAELTFETAAGTWRAHWAQRRARKAAEGKLQAPKHEIAEHESGLIRESSLQKTLAEVEQITGMTFEQFTRSIMLAQGAFAAFLNADAAERGALLEQITGMEIYSEISILVHEKKSAEEKKLKELRLALTSLDLPEEDEKSFKERLEGLNKAAADIEKKLAENNDAVRWLQRMSELEKNELLLAAEEKELADKKKGFEPLALVLQSAHRAAGVEKFHAQAGLGRTLIRQGEEELQNRRRKAGALETAAAEFGGAAAKAEEAALKAKEEEAARLPVFKEARLYDLQMAEKESAARPYSQSRQKLGAALELLKKNSLPYNAQDLEKIGSELSAEQKLLIKLESEVENIRAQLTRDLVLHSLEARRANLKEGQPCELCGSTHHPYADSSLIPVSSLNEKDLGEKIRELESRQKKVAALSIEEAKLKQYLESEAASINKMIARDETQLAEVNQILEKLRQEYKVIRDRRASVLPLVFNPDDEEKKLRKASEILEKGFFESRNLSQAKNSELESFRAAFKEVERSLAKQRIETAAMEQQLAEALRSNGFIDEKAYLEAHLSSDDRQRLEREERMIADSQIALLSRQKDNSSALLLEREKKLSAEPLESLISQAGELKEQHVSLMRNRGALERQLEELRRLTGRQQVLLEQINKQQKEFSRWEKLHDLIGSADGKKYRGFAQNLTFEIMLAQANRQLTSLNDRYFLVPSSESPLELQVIDNYQGGLVRSTKNLSGGESFLTSLALALGLSTMASHKVRVDSLFIDEGFGALDEETLDQALETLASLQRDGKIIGIISHVPAIKERIVTRLEVRPQNGPFSVITGPGVSRS